MWKPKRSVLMPFMIKNMPKCRISQLKLSLYEALVSPILPPAPPYPATSLPINPRKLWLMLFILNNFPKQIGKPTVNHTQREPSPTTSPVLPRYSSSYRNAI